MPYIYSKEHGLGYIDHYEDLEDEATIVIATLMPGIDHIPTTIDEIENVYCPVCWWLDPDECHHPGCQYMGHSLI